eukprot:4439443-Alexandrium_andersonii.AAC.1
MSSLAPYPVQVIAPSEGNLKLAARLVTVAFRLESWAPPMVVSALHVVFGVAGAPRCFQSVSSVAAR